MIYDNNKMQHGRALLYATSSVHMHANKMTTVSIALCWYTVGQQTCHLSGPAVRQT